MPTNASALVPALVAVLLSPTVHGESRYVLENGATEVRDTVTNLTWRRCSEGSAWNGTTCEGVPPGFSLHGALQRAADERAQTGLAWRVPNIKELASLVDLTRRSPAIDEDYFPGVALEYWTSTPYAATPGCCAFFVGFGDGRVSQVPHTYVMRLILVRTAGP